MALQAREQPQTARAGLRLSVVCPFYNEENIIENAALAMHASLTRSFGDDFELILVDDGSKDRSRERLLAMMERTPGTRIRVLGYARNQGRGRALKTGIDAARGALIVTTEADGSWGEDIVQRLVAHLDEHPEADFVIASPHAPGGGLVNVTPRRVFLSRFGNWLIRLFFESEVTMNTGMTRGYRRGVIQPLVSLENGKEFHLEVLLKLMALQFRGAEIPAILTWQAHKLAREPAAKRTSSTNIRRTILTHLRFMVIAQPVRHFALLAAVTLACGTGFLAFAVRSLLAGDPSAFYALIGLNLVLFALMLTGFSVMLHQIRDTMIGAWMRGYPKPHPPSARPGQQLFPAEDRAD